MSAAQAHGMASGMLCANEQAQSSEWLNELFPESTQATDEEKAVLERLFEQTKNLLASDDFEFDLFLPEDDVSLSKRVEALASWCQGFLWAVGFSQNTSDLSKEANGILKDIVEFTKLDPNAEGEEDENDFMEITEYIRSAVLMLRNEFSPE
jgi:yecA family protein